MTVGTRLIEADGTVRVWAGGARGFVELRDYEGEVGDSAILADGSFMVRRNGRWLDSNDC